MICWKCKREMPDGLRYCGNCGVRLNRAMYLVEWIFSKRGLPVLLGLLAVIVGLTIGLSMCGKEPETDHGLENAITEKIQAEMMPGEELPLSYVYSNTVLEAIQFTVEKNEPKKGEATVSFTYVDVMAMAENWGGQSMEQDVFYQSCIDSVLAGTAPIVTVPVELVYTVLVAEDGSEIYVIEDSLALADVLTGGAASAYLDMIGEVQ